MGLIPLKKRKESSGHRPEWGRAIARLLPLLFLLTACDRPPPEVRETLYVFGTLVEVVILDTEEDKARAAMAEVSAAFSHMHADWHAWKPGELSDLNAAIASGQAMRVSDFLLPLLRQGRTYEEMSGGLFNPAIGGLVGLWGFHADVPPEGLPLPTEDKISAWVGQAPSMADLEIDGHTVSSRNPAVRLDFGGFAKGEAVGRAMAILKRHGIAKAVVNAGGGLMVMGDHGDRPWRVGIRHPAHWGVIGSVELTDGEALMTSGNYERFRESEGEHYAHILDPRTGRPVADVVSVSVIHADPALADAAATALTVAGPAHWPEVAEAMGVDQVLLVEADGTVQGTPGMLARVRFEEPPPTVVTR